MILASNDLRKHLREKQTSCLDGVQRETFFLHMFNDLLEDCCVRENVMSSEGDAQNLIKRYHLG